MEALISIKKQIPQRSYSGEKWRTNASNKKRLVIDFQRRCGYCDDHDKYRGGTKAYQVEHFAPKEKFGYLEHMYENLLYCCPYCNNAKSDKWIGESPEENIRDNCGFVDPCSEEYYNHLKRKKDGTITPVTLLGSYMYRELKLYLIRHKILYKLEIINEKIELLKEKIKEYDNQGKDTRKLKELKEELQSDFHDYFSDLDSCQQEE